MKRADIEKFLPSEEDVLFYEEHGWFVTKEVIPENILNDAMQGALGFYKGARDFEISNSRIANNNSAINSLRNNEFSCLQKNELKQLAFHPIVGASAARLARTQEVRLFSDSLICKYPSENGEKGAIGWHSDKAYWPTCSSEALITAWIPLQDVTIDMGPLVHIDGSHKWEYGEKLKSLISFGDAKMAQFEKYVKEEKPDSKTVPMVLKRGQISFHNCLTLHASYPNVSKVNRLVLAVHIQDANNKYKKAFNSSGEPIQISYDSLCQNDSEGNPDYRDPLIFPVLWTEEKLNAPINDKTLC